MTGHNWCICTLIHLCYQTIVYNLCRLFVHNAILNLKYIGVIIICKNIQLQICQLCKQLVDHCRDLGTTGDKAIYLDVDMLILAWLCVSQFSY